MIRADLEANLLPILQLTEEDFRYEELQPTREGTAYYRLKSNSTKYFVKQFLSKKDRNGDSKLLRRAINKDPAGFEYSLLKAYTQNGANVPLPIAYSTDKNILVMEDLGDDTLEKRLLGANEKKTGELLAQAVSEMVNLHRASRQQQALFFKHGALGILKTSRLLDRALNYYGILYADEEALMGGAKQKLENRAEFLESMGAVVKHLYSGEQLVHGDMSTYHVFFKQDKNGEKVSFIDIGNPKFAPVAFDISDLIFSPGVYCSLDKKLEIVDEYFAKDKGVASIKLLRRAAKDTMLGERRRVCFAGIYACLRRAARAREARIKNLKHSKYFARKHPESANPIVHYDQTSQNLINFLVQNSHNYKLDDLEVNRLKLLSPILKKAFLKAG